MTMATAKTKNDDKGQKTLLGFLKPLEKKDGKENIDSSNIKDESMPLSSNLRKSSIKRCKVFAYAGNKKKNSQKTIGGGEANLDSRCDEGTKVCKAFEYEKNKGKKGHFGHDKTCVKNINYKKTNGGRMSMAQYYFNLYESERLKELNRPFEGKEVHTGGNRQADVDSVFNPSSTSDENTEFEEKALEIYEQFGVSKMMHRVNYYIKNPSPYMKKNKTGSVPFAVLAGTQALIDLIPNYFKKGTNDLLGINNKNSNTYKKLQAYRKQFPPGTVGYTFGRADKSSPPDYYYSQLEGRTIYFVCWELNVKGWQPTCFNCGAIMIHDQYDFQTHGYVIPIFDITGKMDYACSMQYDCKRCDNRCKASDGRILMQVPVQYRNGFDVDPRYTVNKETYLSLSFSQVMDKIFITHGNGDQLSTMLNELRGDHYLDVEESYFSQAIDAGVAARALPVYQTYNRRYSPSGSQLRDLKDEASVSILLSTCVPDKERVRREMQSVGCSLTSSSDHTFELMKNYVKGIMDEKACAHTMGTETGEIASVAIVKSTAQREYSHLAEQCTLRGNWKPKIHVTDNCPVGIALWEQLVKGVHCQLGLFHYTYRISKTLNKECKSLRTALSALSACMYHMDQGDLESVKLCLREGSLGKDRNGNRCADEDIDVKATRYREHVRIFIHKERVIQSKLKAWLTTWQDEYDNERERLFTDHTVRTVLEQVKKATYVVDNLAKHELYIQVEAVSRSKHGLPMYVGTRGAESKLEKGHHSIAHFANGGMRHTLADYLHMGGIAIYNLRIRYRLKLAKMPAKERAKIPTDFQKSPHLTNHLRLAHNNMLAKKAGLSNVHHDVEILQDDTGERFFYEYYLQQQLREENGIDYDKNTNRCRCRDCGKVNNPYRKRRSCWTTQQDVHDAPCPLPTPPPIQPPPIRIAVAPPLPTLGPYSQLMLNNKKKTRRRKKKTD